MDWLLNLIRVLPGGAKLVNRIATNKLAGSTRARPNSYSLWSPYGEEEKTSDYLSWHTVTDKNYFDLHLGPADSAFMDRLPSNEKTEEFEYGEITELFLRKEFKPGRSTVFFMFFAQWFTDGFFRSSHRNDRKTSSNHNIDLAQIYGPTEEAANCLRSHIGGKLESQLINGEEFPDYLGTRNSSGSWEVKDRYKKLPYIADEEWQEQLFGEFDDAKKSLLFATGLERGNLIVGHMVLSTLFLREHNKICEALSVRYRDWDDDRLFHTARIINTVILMKLVVEDYVNHIAGRKALLFVPDFAEEQSWYREPWISAEFNLLYRWHGLVPDLFQIGDQRESFVKNFKLVSEKGLATLIQAASEQQAGQISLNNVPKFLMEAEKNMINKGREWQLRSFNDYREAFGLDRLEGFHQLTGDQELGQRLKTLYDSIDNLELTVGLFAESDELSLNGELQRAMVAYDAITQIYTNPLLANGNFTEEHFTQIGLDRIDDTKSFQDLVDRHMSDTTARLDFSAS